jgi:hypothetical protein
VTHRAAVYPEFLSPVLLQYRARSKFKGSNAVKLQLLRHCCNVRSLHNALQAHLFSDEELVFNFWNECGVAENKFTGASPSWQANGYHTVNKFYHPNNIR